MIKDKTKPMSIFMVALFALCVFSVRSSAQTTKSQIQRMSGWSSCTSCAGAGGSGPTASISSGSGVKSPSMSGNSRVFYISSSHPYANALWWKQQGAVNTATHFVYDVYFYLKSPQNSQALEFDANQANGHMRWIFGTQCNIGGGHWDVWGNKQGNWLSTGIPCKMPSGYKWHHLTWEFKRTSTTLTYVSFTYDGVKHYVNRTYTGRASSIHELNVAVQLDLKGNHAAYSEWVDNASLKYW